MPVLDSRSTTPIVRRAPTGTLHTEIGGSVFYSKSKITQMASSSSVGSLDERDGGEDDSTGELSKLNGTVSSRFPKLQECAHFHYESSGIEKIQVSLYDSSLIASCSFSSGEDFHRSVYHGLEEDGGDYFFTLNVNSQGRSWLIRRSYRDFRKFDRQLHKCVFDRKFSQLEELIKPDSVDEDNLEKSDIHPGSYYTQMSVPRPLDKLRTINGQCTLFIPGWPALAFMLCDNIRSFIRVESLFDWKIRLNAYLLRFSQIAGNLITCAPVLNWFELDNRGFHLIVSDDSAINTPAVAAVHVVKRYVPQANDELTLEVGDMLSVIDMPPSEESIWWRGKKELDVGFFPSDCVQVIGGGKMPPHATNQVPVLRKRGKLIAFFRSFLSARPSRRRLKESGILKERVYGCDLSEHLLNTGQKVPAVLIQCTTFIEEHMQSVDGIYRLSGISSNIQKLRLEFDAEKTPDLTAETYLQDIHAVASVLKLYFRELPNPLLTYQLYEKFVEAVQSTEEMRLLKIHDVVNHLPPPHFRTLEYLMRHLARIATHSSKTGMNSKNLAIVWAPNLLRSSETENSVDALRGVSTCAIAIELLVKYADLIFGNQLHTSSLLTRAGYAAKSNRPKSVAVSTPSKLISLDEARLLTRPNLDQKFIEVGAGSENVPKYHTVISLTKDRKKRSNSTKSSEKSPSSWRSIFATKNRKALFGSHFDAAHPNPPLSASSLSLNKKPKLRAAQSANGLDSPRSQSTQPTSVRNWPFDDEPRSLRIFQENKTAMKSNSPGHSRSLSLDSCFRAEETNHSTPRTVIDVIRTIPYSQAESGCLVKLSIDEEPEGSASPEPPKIFHENCSRQEMNVPGGNGLEKPRYKKLSRTLSPEFLRKHREPLRQDGTGVKRSLSASPKTTHRYLPALKESGGSSEIRTSSAGGRKSFRRSTSEEDLAKAAALKESLSNSARETSGSNQLSSSGTSMDLSSASPEIQIDSRPFESREMELFDDICAEICAREPDECIVPDNAALGDSLQDIADIREELELEAAFARLVPSAPDLSVEEDFAEGRVEVENAVVESPSSVLELRSLFSPDRPSSMEYVQQSASATVVEDDEHPTVTRSRSYFFGQTEAENRRKKLEWFERRSCPDMEAEFDLFSIADQQVVEENQPNKTIPVYAFGQPEMIYSSTESSTDADDIQIGEMSSSKDQTVPTAPNDGSSEILVLTPESTPPVPFVFGGHLRPETFVMEEMEQRSLFIQPRLSPSSADLFTETETSQPERLVPQNPVEYVLVLEKPVALLSDGLTISKTEEPLETSSENAPESEVTPPSVRSLRSRFESSQSVPASDTISLKSNKSEIGSLRLKQNLRDLSDYYKDNPPVQHVPILREEVITVPLKPLAKFSGGAKNACSFAGAIPVTKKLTELSGDCLPEKKLKVREMRQLFQQRSE